MSTSVDYTSVLHSDLDLRGDYVRLVPLERTHLPALQSIAADQRIWEHYLYDCSQPDVFHREMENAFVQRELGHHFPFVIKQRDTDDIVGSTRLLDIQPAHRKVEIGWTWMHPDTWGSVLNLEAKLLLLQLCFEELHVVRVLLKTDERNTRSRKAIEKIGAQFEGILRNDMIRDNGTCRNSAYYSIIDSEWMMIRAALRARIHV